LGLPDAIRDRIASAARFRSFARGELMEQRTLPLVERLRVVILRNADEHGELRLSHDELAELVGSTRANVTHALKQMAEAGQVRVQRRVIRILSGCRDCGCWR